MRKLTALSLSLFLCLGAFAQDKTLSQKVSASEPAGSAQSSTAFEVRSTEGIDLSVRALPGVGQRTGALEQVVAKTSPNKVMAKGNVTTENLYAAITYPSALLGFQQVNVSAGTFTQVAAFSNTAYKPQAFGIADGKIYSLDWTLNSSNQVTGAYINIIDMASGSLVKSISIVSQFADTPQGGCFVADEMAFYGYANNGWSKMDATTGDCTILAPDDAAQQYTRNLTYNPVDGEIYGMLSAGKTLVKVDKANGATTVLKDTSAELYTGYTGGFCYDADSDSFIFNRVDAASTPNVSTLMAISGSNYAISQVCEFQTMCQSNSMFCNETAPMDPDAPQAPEYLSSSFLNGALFGQVSFQLPTLMVDGSDIAGNVNYTVTAAGEVVASGKGVPGSTVTSNVQVSEQGDIPFTFVASINGHNSKPAKQNIYIGTDTPLAPANVVLTVQTVTWDPVTKGVHNGFLDLNKLTYTVKINGQLVADGLTTTSCATNIPLTSDLSNYVAEVYAVCNGMTSAAGSSNSLLFGQAYSVPVELLPTAEEAQLFEVLDVNNDARTWEYYASSEAFRYRYHSQNAADDWLILPPMRISDYNALYEFSVDAWSSASYEENFEVYAGPTTDVNSMTKIMDEVSVKWAAENKKTFNTIFEAPKGGKMYIAIKCTSLKDEFYLYVNNFSVKKSAVSVNGPAAVTNLVGTPGANGALEATLTFNMPTTTFGGAPLTGDVTVEVENLIDYKTVTGAPGSAQTVKLTCLQTTTDTADPITITPSQGDQMGMPSTIDVWTGVDLPATPQGVTITPNQTNMGGTLSWEKVGNVGKNGGYVNPADVEYYLCQRVYVEILPGMGSYSWQIQGLIGKDVDSWTFTLADGTALGTIGLSVISGNAAGQNTSLFGALCVLGTPYSIPAVENYPSGSANYPELIYGYNPTTPTMSVTIKNPSTVNAEYASDEHPYALICTYKGEGTGFVDLPPFSTKGATKVAFIPNVYIGSCENFRVTATTYGVEETEVFNLSTLVNVDLGVGYNDLILELPQAFQNKDWVKLTIHGDFTTAKPYLIMGGYSLRNLVPYDVAATNIAAPKKVTTGQDYEVKVTTSNYGLQSVSEYTVELYADGELVDTQVGGTIESDGSATVTFTRSMSPIATEVVEYYAKATCANDASSLNAESATIEVAPKVSSLPGASELQANNNSEGSAVTLTWLEPNLDNVVSDPITDDFEDGDAFAAEYGDWVFVDVDESEVGGFQGTDIPGITPGTTKGSFWIWDQSQLGNQTFEAHSGTKYLFALFRYDDGATDDWAISPELAGTAQTISFWAKSYSSSYPEKIKVWYSTGSVEVEDFVELDIENGDPVPGDWTEYTVDLPEGAKRFAINSCATGSFMLMVDDVTYIPAGGAGDASLLGYDIYRDGVKINSALVEENDFTDSNVEKGKTYNYVVVAVFDKGSAKPSNTATITVKEESGILDVTATKAISAGKGFIRINGFAGEEVVIATVDGKVVAKGNASELNTVNVPAGVYVVKAGKKVAKVVVK